MQADEADAWVLWDVVEEHLDEAEFGVVQFRRMLDHPSVTLADLGSWQERLAAHVDGLVVGGPAVIRRLVVPALEAAEEPERVTACALALLESGDFGPFHAALAHPQEPMRRAAAWACSLTSAGDKVARTAAQRLHAAASADERCGLLEVLAARGAGHPLVIDLLGDDESATLAAALRVAPFCQGPGLVRAIENHLDSSDPSVIEAALFAALVHESALAFDALESYAATGPVISPPLLALLAALGGPRQHAAIADRVGSAAHARAALFALGYSGNPAHAPLLLDRLRGPDETLAKIAAQSLSISFGLDLDDARFQLPPRPSSDLRELPPPEDDPEALEALPPFEGDDLDALPLPEPEDDLPAFDPDAIEREVARVSAGMQPGKRHLAGQVYSHAGLLDLLVRTPLRRRHTLAQALFIETCGSCHVDSRASVERQRHQLGLASQQASKPRRRYPIG